MTASEALQAYAIFGSQAVFMGGGDWKKYLRHCMKIESVLYRYQKRFLKKN
jgi:hypothetical protein